MSIWDELGIARTNDIRQIKKAYAAKSKLVHPEEHPEEFRQLHEAYESALMYAKANKNQVQQNVSAENVQDEEQRPFTESQFDFKHTDHHSQIEKANEVDSDKTDDIDFSSIQQSSDKPTEEEEQGNVNFDFDKAIYQSEIKRNNQIMEMTETVIRNADKLYHSKVFDTEMQWLDVFNNDFVDSIINEPIFLNELCSFLRTHKVNENMANALFKVFHLGDIVSYKDKGQLEEIYNLVIQAKAEASNRLEMKIKLCTYFTFVSLILFVVAIILPNLYLMAAMIFAFVICMTALINLKARRKKFYE